MCRTRLRRSWGGPVAPFVRAFAFVAAVLAWTSVPAQQAPETDRIRDGLDVREHRPASPARRAEWLARTRWVQRETEFRFGANAVARVTASGAALHHLYRTDGPLSEPREDEPLEIARAFLREHQDLFGLSPADIDGLWVVKSYRTAHNGVHHLLLQQTVDGVPVFHGEVRVNLTCTSKAAITAN